MADTHTSPQLTLATNRPADSKAELLVIATSVSGVQGDLASLGQALTGHLSATTKRADFKGAEDTTLLFQTHGAIAPHTIVLAGCAPTASPRTWHQLADVVVRHARELKANGAAVAFGKGLESTEAVFHVAEGLALSAYGFERFKSRPCPASHPARVDIHVARAGAGRRTALERGQLFAAAACYARDLVMTPAAALTPAALAGAARRLAQRQHLQARILGPGPLARLRMGAILGVAQGSAQPPRLIELVYRPRTRAKLRLAIAGKGITFDSGGLSLKNPEAMQPQKRDMAGGAAVLGAMSVIAQLAPPVEVRAYIAAAENMPGGRALKPGDVVRAYNGKTIEVLNTDAEGRLVLADALSYAARGKPDVIIDLATLTAAVGAALGRRYAGIMGSDPQLVAALIAAGQRAGENLWQLPLVEDYRPDLNSRIADLKNTGEGYAGTIIGGLFLREFVGERPWAHIDFSSTVVTDKPFPAHPVGATGFGARTLLQYITAL
ncbi:MAG: leucyl aminopeptidase [Deltaproteobacteria bacterium]|nr:leucyl aminopeptidase [Deltaproteobacteria bacterium]